MEQTKYDVFISYSRKDYLDDKGNIIPGNEVTKIIDALKEANITFWYDQNGNMHGKDFGAEILKYIKASKIFVFLSTVAANDSEWTRREIACALEYTKKIIPVRIDASRYHDSVMFRIADLDYIKYGSNPKKGREELVDTIKYYMAEEKAAAARREAEEQRRREEQERQHRQQEELRRKQQQADELRAEISKTEADCTSLEKTLMLKKHDLDVVNLELEAKRKHLDEQKKQMNSILYEDNITPEPSSSVPSFAQNEYEGFNFCWRHPMNSFREMWSKLKETFIQRHWLVSVILCLYVAFSTFCSIGFFALYDSRDAAPFVVVILTLYALFQLLLNKRSSFGFMLLTPIMTLLISYFYSYYNFSYWRIYFQCDVEHLFVTFSLSCIPPSLVFPILLIRKGGKSAWSLLDGKIVHAFHINKNMSYYIIYSILLLFSILYFENNVEKANCLIEEKQHNIEELRTERDSLIAERDSLIAEQNIFMGADANTLYNIGYSFYNSKNYKKAVELYRIALDKGLYRGNEKYAQYYLGICYEKGLGVEPDTAEAIKWYKAAYEGGDYVSDACPAYHRLEEELNKKQ